MTSVEHIHQRQGRQQGAALLVVLMVLLIVTLLGIAAMRGAIMQERMAANITTRSMSFQVAEAGLRQGEIIARDGTITFPTSGCSAGRCADASWMSDTSFWNNGGTGYQTGNAVPVCSISITPRFIIENFGRTSVGGGSNCIDMTKPCITATTQSVYRVTSFAQAPDGAEVILQSIYRR